MKTGRLQKRISGILILLTVFHTVILGTYFAFVIAGNIKKEVQNTINVKSTQISAQVDHINELVSHYSTVLLENESARDILEECDFSKNSRDTAIAANSLDRLFSSLFTDSYDARGCILFPKKGGPYIFKNSLDEVIFTAEYLNELDDVLKKSGGQIVWFGKHTFENLYGEKEDYFIVGRSLRDYSSLMEKSFEKVADVCYIFKARDIISFDLGNENDEEILIILNPKRETVYSSLENEETKNALNALLQRGENNSFSADFETINLKTEHIFAKSTVTPLTGWYVITGNKNLRLEYQIIKAVGIMLLVFIISVLVVNFLFNMEIKKLFKPIKSITEAMEKIGKKNFDICLETKEVGELGIICDGINQMSKELDSLFKKTILIEKQKKAEQIKALQYQMNPHFLYNTLASLKMLAIQKDEDEIAQNIEALSRLLRNTISRSSDLITIEDELNNIKDYILLQQFRYKNGITVSYDVEEDVLNASVPNLLIQPLVENAIIHGLSEKINRKQYALLKISVKREGNNVKINIYDNGTGYSPADGDKGLKVGNRVGIKNINDRIKLIYGEEYSLGIDTKIGEFTDAQIIIPYKTPE